MDEEWASDFIDFFCNISGAAKYVTWYQRIVSADRPAAAVNLKGVTINAGATYMSDPTKRVSEVSAAFTNKGTIPLEIQRSPGNDLTEVTDMLQYKGSHTGTCSKKFEINVEDHLVDEDGREYRVVHSTKISEFFRHMNLLLLPGETY